MTVLSLQQLTSSRGPVRQIGDGQVQNPNATVAACTVAKVSSLVSQVTVIPDGQPQAPKVQASKAKRGDLLSTLTAKAMSLVRRTTNKAQKPDNFWEYLEQCLQLGANTEESLNTCLDTAMKPGFSRRDVPGAMNQIPDGQVQDNPSGSGSSTGCDSDCGSESPSAVSSLVPHVTAIADGQPQAPKSLASKVKRDDADGMYAKLKKCIDMGAKTREELDNCFMYDHLRRRDDAGSVNQIPDGQIQNQPAGSSSVAAAPTVLSSLVPHVTAIADGQPQSPKFKRWGSDFWDAFEKCVKLGSQTFDDLTQCHWRAQLQRRDGSDPVNQIPDGQIQNPPSGSGSGSAPGSDSGSGPGAGSESAVASSLVPHVTAIADGQPQAPKSKEMEVGLSPRGEKEDAELAKRCARKGISPALCFGDISEKRRSVPAPKDKDPEDADDFDDYMDVLKECFKRGATSMDHVNFCNSYSTMGDGRDVQAFKDKLDEMDKTCERRGASSSEQKAACFKNILGMKRRRDVPVNRTIAPRDKDPEDADDYDDYMDVLKECFKRGATSMDELASCFKDVNVSANPDDFDRFLSTLIGSFAMCETEVDVADEPKMISCMKQYLTRKLRRDVPINQIADGQPQNKPAPASSQGPPTVASSLVPHVTAFVDGQPQAPKAKSLDARDKDPEDADNPNDVVDVVYECVKNGARNADQLAACFNMGQMKYMDNVALANAVAKHLPPLPLAGRSAPPHNDAELYTCAAAGTLRMTLVGGVLKDSLGRTGYIADNRQFQFDGPPQAGALITSGFSVCGDGRMALGGSTTWYQCASGDFYNLYDKNWAPHCEPVEFHVVKLVNC